MNVLSVFDGMSCAQIALERTGFKVDNYFASEIDKFAIKVTQSNYPETIQLGDITKIHGADLPAIDLLVGGSPCQGFSYAGKGLNFNDPRSALFFEFVRLLKEVKPKWFLLENVKMGQKWQDVISGFLGVEPIEINSALISAQNRKRLYWTNIPNITQPKDKHIFWGDVRERGVELSPIYYSERGLRWIGRHGERKGKQLRVHNDNEKMQMVEATHYKKYGSQRFFGIIDTPEKPAAIVGRKLNENKKRDDYNNDLKTVQCLEVSKSKKIRCLSTVRKDFVVSNLPIGRYPNVFQTLQEGKHYRYITPLECERLQTVPDNYTDSVSNTQRYKMLGNGFTVDVIAHILSNINE